MTSRITIGIGDRQHAEELSKWWDEQPPCVYCGIPVAWNPQFIQRIATGEYTGSWIHRDGNKSCDGVTGVAWPKGDVDTTGKPFWGFNMLADASTFYGATRSAKTARTAGHSHSLYAKIPKPTRLRKAVIMSIEIEERMKHIGAVPYEGVLPEFFSFVCPHCEQYKMKSVVTRSGVDLEFICMGPHCGKRTSSLEIRLYKAQYMVEG